jgi:uncharacterized membrane protein
MNVKAISMPSWLTPICLIALALVLRIYNLGTESIWIDESVSIRQASLPFMDMIAATARDNYPPLHNVVLHYWMKLFGSSELAVRAPSALFGALAVLMAYLLSNRMFDRYVAGLGAFFLALSQFHIRYSQEARMYSLMALLALVSMYFFVRLLEGHKLRYAIAYVVSSSLLLYTHVYGPFVLLIQNAFIFSLVVFRPRQYRINLGTWLIVQTLVAASFVPWIKVLFTRISSIQEGFWVDQPGLRDVLSTLMVYAGSSQLFIVSVIVIYAGFFGMVKVERATEVGQTHNKLANADACFLLILWLMTPILIPFLISQVLQPIYLTRYTIGGSVAWYILLATGIRFLPGRNFHKYFAVAILAAGTALAVYSFFSKFPRKENWRTAVEVIEERAASGDSVLFYKGFNDQPFNYYAKREDLVKERFPKAGDVANDASIDALKRSAKERKRIWLIFSHATDSDERKIVDALSQSHEINYYEDFPCAQSEQCIEAYLFVESSIPETRQ